VDCCVRLGMRPQKRPGLRSVESGCAGFFLMDCPPRWLPDLKAVFSDQLLTARHAPQILRVPGFCLIYNGIGCWEMASNALEMELKDFIEKDNVAMLPTLGYEAAIRLSVAYTSIAVGTVILLTGMTNSTADGEPFSYPIWNGLNLLILTMPSLAAMIYLYLGKNLKLPSWFFTAFCCYWACDVCNIYKNGGFKFIYWHQGDVACETCYAAYLSLSSATIIFGLCGFIIIIMRLRHSARAGIEIILTTVIALLLLLFSMIVVGLFYPAPLFGLLGCVVIIRQLDYGGRVCRDRLSIAVVVLGLLIFSMLAFGLS
jgi:hypothetical protein